ncbi:hypothetical protein TMES_08605 [Thalassospira mesophila]|uniref:Uncharacterized protein n=1 Tax=Thalassospira mesophila TaxID=1293891 RepID=A0A1Y2L1M4_9PROT|nr:hypothetical protein TMES_08605 [Thalassospira mesophila]
MRPTFCESHGFRAAADFSLFAKRRSSCVYAEIFKGLPSGGPLFLAGVKWRGWLACAPEPHDFAHNTPHFGQLLRVKARSDLRRAPDIRAKQTH